MPLSYLLISFRLNYIVLATLTLSFAAEVLTRWAARQLFHFWVSFLCASYVKGVICITVKKKVLIHILNVPTDEFTTSGANSVVEKRVKLLGFLVP